MTKENKIKELTKFLKAKAKEYQSDWEDVPEWLIDASIEWMESKEPTKEDKAIELASHYLSDGDLTTKEMVEAIANHEDQYDLIDNVEGVVVWQKVEMSFTCEQFLEEIGW